LGCRLGGAAGDALGAPVEFMTRSEILTHFGPDGITAFAPVYGGVGRITDDTRMTMFTALTRAATATRPMPANWSAWCVRA
jgi:ADP-ribosylglycohydrolase